MKTNLITLLLFILFFQGHLVYTQPYVSGPYQTLTDGIAMHNENNVQQHVFLHLNKDIFRQGERIWFKAYVFCGRHIPDTVSENLYVELWSPSEKRVAIARLKLRNGLAEGSLFFSDTLEQGIYQLRAFTDLMLDNNAGFYYNKNISFHNSNHSSLISKSEARKNRKTLEEIARRRKKFQIHLFMDGGTLVAGQQNKVYYKSTNVYGEPVEVNVKRLMPDSAVILTDENNYSGGGYFFIIPKENINYEVLFQDRRGKRVKCKLPPALQSGLTGTISQSAGSVHLFLKKPFVISNDPSANRYFVLAMSGSKYLYNAIVDLRNDTLLTFSKQTFPPGVLTFSVLSNRLLPAAQFRIFLQPDLAVKPKISYSQHDDTITLKINNNSIDYLKYASVSATIESEPIKDNKEKFAIQTYLDSDLDGTYWGKSDSLSFPDEKRIDFLMNTSGLCLPIGQIVTGGYKEKAPQVPESGIEVSGRILSDVFSVPYKNLKVRLEVMDRYNDIFETYTNELGQFRFAGFDFYDTLRMKLICSKYTGKNAGIIEFESDRTRELSEYYGNFFLTTHSTRNNKLYRKEMATKARTERMKQEEELNEFYSDQISGRPDFVLFGKDLPQHKTVIEAINGRVPGVSVSGNEILIRGMHSLYASTQPLVIVDNIPSDVNRLSDISVSEVERIEFLKGTSASVYGARGANGVILVYTIRGEFTDRGVLDFTVYGYQKPQKFESGFINDANIASKLPITLFWSPNLNIKKSEELEIKIKKPDLNYPLKIEIEGVTESGKPVSVIYWIE